MLGDEGYVKHMAQNFVQLVEGKRGAEEREVETSAKQLRMVGI